jgi:pimeloyl-ACP methyl ester carboxylesterase
MTILLLIAVLAAVAAGALVFRSYDAELRQARDAASRGGRIANTSAGPIEYADKGGGIPLLSIHGAGGGYDQGLVNVADLVGDNFRVIAPSRFGYLGTPVPSDQSVAAQADAHAALLTELNVDKAIVVGVSAGARSAVELAVRHSDRVAGPILIVPGTYAQTSPVAVEASRASALVLWLVNNGADFAWWAAEKIAVDPDSLPRSPAGTVRRLSAGRAGTRHADRPEHRAAIASFSGNQYRQPSRSSPPAASGHQYASARHLGAGRSVQHAACRGVCGRHNSRRRAGCLR